MRRPPKDKEGHEVAAPSSVNHDPRHKRRSTGEQVELVRQVRGYELITPLYGGGVEPAHADPLTTIRVPGIRGQLRFWWRACRAAQFSSVAEMKKAEDLIWGSTENPSALILELKLDKKAKVEKDAAYWMERNPQKNRLEAKSSPKIHPYAAFPLQPDEKERKQADWKSEDIITGVHFSLLLGFPQHLLISQVGASNEREVDIEKEIHAALWAWETFGGVGARTRRGFGALSLRSVDGHEVPLPHSKDLIGTIDGMLLKHVASGEAPKSVPHLKPGTAVSLTPLASDSIRAWGELIEKLKSFRQYRRDKNTGRPSPFGKSQWPEPDAIRRLIGKRKGVGVEKFPRADFGLPIIFHMPHDGGIKVTLKGQGVRNDDGDFERLASPLILRPIRCTDGAVGMALILEAPRTPPGGLLLDGENGRNLVHSTLSDEEARQLTRRLEPLDNQTDVLQAFLQFLTVRRSQR